jgi:periplasmic divalent cation tolerance protein
LKQQAEEVIMSGHIVVLCTVPDKPAAQKIAEELLTARLAACVNLTGPIDSLYWWEGRIQRDSEVLMIIKTREELFDRLEEAVRRLHPYDVPEVVGLPIVRGSAPYLGWITEETGGNME